MTTTNKKGLSTDRRVRKTKKQLRLGLTKLLKEKSIKDISVRELADVVDINRSTFYTHYRDIYDMVEQIENEMFEEFNQLINTHSSEDLKTNLSAMLVDIYRFIFDYSDMCAALLGKNGDMAFVDKLKDVVRNKCLNEWFVDLIGSKSPAYEYYYSFIVLGCIGLMQTWLEHNMDETPEQMAKLTEQIITKGMMLNP